MRRLCALSELEEGTLTAMDGAADALLVLRRGAAVRVWHNVCPHAGRRLDWAPGRFLRDGEQLVCAHHGAVFELDGGKCIGGPCQGASLAAPGFQIIDGEVWLEVD